MHQCIKFIYFRMTLYITQLLHQPLHIYKIYTLKHSCKCFNVFGVIIE